MAKCDPRAYYPASNGVFKLRKEDGDLIWEAISTGTSTVALAMYGDDVIAPGWRSAIVRHWHQTDGRISGGTVLTGPQQMMITEFDHGKSQVIGDTLVIAGTSNPGLFFRFDLTSGSFLGSRTILSNTANFCMHSATQCDQSAIEFLRRTDLTTGASTISPRNRVFDGRDCHDLLLPRDDEFYYCAYQSTAASMPESQWSDFTVVKVSRTDLSTVGAYHTNPVEWLTPLSWVPRRRLNLARVRDGLLAFNNGGVGSTDDFVLVETAGMTEVFWCPVYAIAQRMWTFDVCDQYIAALCTPTAGHTGVWQIKKISLDGAVIWTQEYSAPIPPSGGNLLSRKIVISQDASTIYVAADFLINGLPIGVIALDADTGDQLWCFSCGRVNSLIERDDGIYISTVATSAPRYR